MEEALIKKLLASLECGVCKQRYQGDNINVLDHHDNLWFLSAYCPACHSRCLVAAVIEPGKEPEVATDLTEAELDEFLGVSRVSVDDVLDMHCFLKDFDSDFTRLFQPRQV